MLCHFDLAELNLLRLSLWKILSFICMKISHDIVPERPIVFFGGQKTDKIVWAYLQILYLDNFYLCARRLPPLLMLLRLPPSLFEASFVAFASSNVDVSWYLSAMLIDTNCGFAVGYEFYLLRWIMCSQLRLLQYNIWVALAVVKCFFLSTLKLDHLTE
jgi:hypothetical protein